MSTTQPDLFEVRRDTGIARAVDHADRVVNSWSEDCYRMLVAYAPGREFIAEQFTEFALGAGLPAPPTKRAFGGPIRRAALAGVIRRVGYSLDKYASPKARWSGRA